jgi:TetR/AcrR family transcriptional repressor of mexJK operon
MTASTIRSPSRRETQRQTRRDAIVQVAARYFIEHGYAATTMSGIATALGGSKGTLWNHFPSKEELFVAVLDRLTEDFRTQLLLILDPRHDFEKALRRFCREFLNKVTSRDGIALYRLVISETNRFPEIGRIFHERGPQPTQHLLADFLAGAATRGVIDCDHPLDASRQLIGLLVSGARQNMLIGLIDELTPKQIGEEIDRAMSIFMRAYAIR